MPPLPWDQLIDSDLSKPECRILSGRSRPLISMVESTEAGQGNQLSCSAFSSLHQAPVRCVFAQSIVGSVFVVIVDVFPDQSSQVSLTKNNHMIQQVSATALHPSFGHPVLPRTANRMFGVSGCPRSRGYAMVHEIQGPLLGLIKTSFRGIRKSHQYSRAEHRQEKVSRPSLMGNHGPDSQRLKPYEE